jgi:hypothetical protein
MELIKIADEILKTKDELKKIRCVLKKRGLDYAKAKSDYRRKLAVTIIQLRNGKELELDGEKIKNPTATSTNEISRGICWQEKLKEEETLALVKAGYSNLKAVELQLSALQSVFKRLDNV